MANRIGGRPYKKRLLPGVGYPIPISPAAAPSLVQSGAVAMAGAVSTSGNIGFNLGLTQTGAVAVSGAVTTTGSIGFDLGLSQSGAVAVSGALSASGDIAQAITLSQTGAVAVSGSVSASGDLTITPGSPFELTQSGAIGISGGVSIGDSQFTLNEAVPVTGGWPTYWPRRKKRRDEPKPEEVTVSEPQPAPDAATAREILRAKRRADKVMAELKAIYRQMDATEIQILRKQRELEEEEETLLLLIASM